MGVKVGSLDIQFSKDWDPVKGNQLVQTLQQVLRAVNALANQAVTPPPSPVAVHELASQAGLGPDHTVAGLKAGQVLIATSATGAQFAFLSFGQIQGTDAGTFVAPANGDIIAYVNGYWSAIPNTLGLGNPGADAVIIWDVTANHGVGGLAWALDGLGIKIGTGQIAVDDTQLTHGHLLGLLANDHPQYALVVGTPQLATPNTFTQLNTFLAGLVSGGDITLVGNLEQSGAEPEQRIKNTDDQADEGTWREHIEPGQEMHAAVNDDGSDAENWLYVQRIGDRVAAVGISADSFEVQAPTAVFAGTVQAAGFVGPGAPTQGPPGVPGVQGPPGRDGDPGEDGMVGPAGSQGIQGATGPAGSSGSSSSTGQMIMDDLNTGEEPYAPPTPSNLGPTTFNGEVVFNGAPTATGRPSGVYLNGAEIAVFSANATAATNRALIRFQQGGGTVAQVGADGSQSLAADSVNGDLVLCSTSGSIRLTANNGTSTQVLLASAGNVTIAAPTSGFALTATGIAGQYAANFIGSSTSGQSKGVVITAGTTSADVSFVVNQIAGFSNLLLWGDGHGSIGYGGTSGGTIQFSATGNVNIQAPASGFALTVNQVAGAVTQAAVFQSTAGNNLFVEFSGNGGTPGTTSLAIGQTAAGVSTILARSGNLQLGAGGVQNQINLTPAGNVTIAAPSSGTALTVTGVTGSSAAQFLTTGVQVGAPTGGDKGSGTINVAAGYYIGGVNTVQAGTFTGTLTGCTTAPTATFNYTIVDGAIATIYCTAGLTGTSNATTCTVTGLPAALTPVTQSFVVCAVNNNTVVAASAGVSGTTLSLFTNVGGTGGFSASPITKGVSPGFTITYSLK